MAVLAVPLCALAVITTYAGNGIPGFAGDGGPASAAALASPRGLAVDSAGNLYIADSGNHRVRRVDQATRIITTVAGNGAAGFAGDGGVATSARLNSPSAIEFDDAGNLYIADTENHRIRRVAAGTGIITTVAGTGTAGFKGDGGPGTSVALSSPMGMSFVSSPERRLYIADSGNAGIRQLNLDTGLLTTIARTEPLPGPFWPLPALLLPRTWIVRSGSRPLGMPNC